MPPGLRARQLEEAFESALGWNEYLESDPVKAEPWQETRSQVQLNSDQERLLSMFTRSMPILMISGIWCGDCVRQGPVLQALAEQTRSVRIPLNQNSNLAKLARTDTQLTQSLGRSPTDLEIAQTMEEPVETIRALRRVAASELSLDAPIDRGDRDSSSYGERFAGAAGEDIEEDVEAIARRDFLETMFESYLTERERKILYLYYGLDDGEERTLEEIGSLLGVTRERIRQIRNRAFEKLRESPHGESLSGFWNAH